MDLLDENQIDSWIQLLTEAKTIGFSFSSSPVEPLLELMVDLAVKLKNEFLEDLGTFWDEETNPSLKFSKTQVDSLSNPKVIYIRDRKQPAWDPRLSSFFGELAANLIRIKRLRKLPTDLYSEGKQQTPNRSKIKRSTYFFRKRARRRQKNGHH